jgi:hypothetical protein
LSISWQSDVVPRPAILVLPPGADSLDEAHAAVQQWEFYSGKTLDSSQRLTVEVMMAESGGRWAARTTGREMPRQNGKGDELEVVELWGIVQRGESILHTAHELTTVSSAHGRMVSLIEGHADLRRMKSKVLNGIGQQLIELKNKKTGLTGVIAYRTRTNGGGRGLDDISRLVIDEAQHAKPEQLASSTPILLANPNPQMNFAGTGGISGVSDWWWDLRKRAIGATPGRLGYVGHTAESVYLDGEGRVVQLPVDAEDRENWFDANPALHVGRGELEFFEEQLLTLGPMLFAREHLGVWDPPASGGSHSAIPNWADLVDETSRIVTHRQWSLAVSDDRKWAAISVAGRNIDGRLHIEWKDHRAGTGWIVDQVVESWLAKKIPIQIHKSGPEGAFIGPLRERGVKVVEVSTAEAAQATGQIIDAAANGQLVHVGQKSMAVAVKGAVLRMSSDGAAVWSQRSSEVEITPLRAATIAAGAVSEPAPTPRPLARVISY